MTTDPRRTRKWRDLASQRRKFYQDNNIYPPCHLCGEPINPFVSGRTKYGLTLDHDVSIRNGGDPFASSNLRDAHNSCNGQKSAGIQSDFIRGPSYVASPVHSMTTTPPEPMEPVRLSRCWGNPMCHGRSRGCAECEARHQRVLAYDNAHTN